MTLAKVAQPWLWALACCLRAAAAQAQTQKTTTAAPGNEVVMLSDLHFDPLRDPGKATRLAAASVERWDAILREPDSPGQTESFAAVEKACPSRGLDSDHTLLESALRAARQNAPGARFVTVSGDLLVHGFDCRYRVALKGNAGYAEFAEKTAAYVIERVENEFAKAPVYVALGNNDSSCGDYRMDLHDRFLKATTAAVLRGLRRASAQEVTQARADYEAGGYFGVSLETTMPKTRLLVVDDIFASRRYLTCAGRKDASGADAMLAWLGRQLEGARARGERVWVMGHVPPAVDVYTTLSRLRNVCGGAEPEMFLASDALGDLLVKYADVVTLGIFAHTHMDELRLLRSGMGAGGVPVKFVASVSPVDGNTPSFTVARVDATKASLKDFSVYVQAGPAWRMEYGFDATYHQGGFSAKSLGQLIAGFRADAGGTAPASQAYERDFYSGEGSPLGLVWPGYTCALDQYTAEGYRGCVCGIKPGSGAVIAPAGAAAQARSPGR